jgi:uncharacterized membrane protein YfcA
MNLLIGFVIAVIIALTGVGAGTITAPLLILFLHIPVEVAVSTALAYSAVVKLIVVPVQIWRKQVSYRVLGYMLLGGLPGVVLGSILFAHVVAHGSRSFLYAVLGAIIVFSSGWHVYRHFFPSAQPRSTSDQSSLPAKRRKWVSLLMFPIGAEVGFSSSGAGALGTVALLGLTTLSASQVVGTDLSFGLGLSIVGTGVHMLSGYYDASLLLQLALGGILGALLGSGVAPRVPNRQLRLALSLWLLLIGFGFCYQASQRSAEPRITHAYAHTDPYPHTDQ